MISIRLRFPQWTEPVSVLLLGVVLLLRYPIHFALEPPFLMDFEVYRAAAERLLHAAGAQLYDPMTSEMMIFKYAPVWALLWTPLGWLSKQAGGLVWTTGSVLALLATAHMAARLCRHHGLPYHSLTAVIAVLILVRPLAQEMGNGQSNLLWGCLTVGFVYAAARHRPWLAAGLLAGAILLKLPALIFLPYLLLRRDWKAVGRVLGIACAATLAASALIAPQAPLQLVHAWARALSGNASAYAFIIGNQSFLALQARFLTADGYGLNLLNLSHAAIVGIQIGLAVALILLLGLRTAAREEPRRFLYDTAILMVGMVIFSPTCFAATYTALLYPVFLAVAGMTHQFSFRRWHLPTFLFAGLVTLASLLTHHKIWRLLHMTTWRGEAYLFLVFMVLPWLGLALVGLLWQQRQVRLPEA